MCKARHPPEQFSSPRPGTVGNLTPEQKERYGELQRVLADSPEYFIEAHRREGRRRRLLRHLRACSFDVEDAAKSVHSESDAWQRIRMDGFAAEDEMDEACPLYVCGEDLAGHPTLIARPCVHFQESAGASIATARRCAFTLQRAIERMPPGVEQVCVLYDVAGASMANMDRAFVREIVTCMSPLFPDRMVRCTCINVHWTMMALWRHGIKPLLNKRTLAKVQLCGDDFSAVLADFLPADHPYWLYLVDLERSRRDGTPAPPPPLRSPYVPRWRDCLAADGAEQQEDVVERVRTPPPLKTDAGIRTLAIKGGCCIPSTKVADAISRLWRRTVASAEASPPPVDEASHREARPPPVPKGEGDARCFRPISVAAACMALVMLVRFMSRLGASNERQSWEGLSVMEFLTLSFYVLAWATDASRFSRVQLVAQVASRAEILAPLAEACKQAQPEALGEAPEEAALGA